MQKKRKDCLTATAKTGRAKFKGQTRNSLYPVGRDQTPHLSALPPTLPPPLSPAIQRTPPLRLPHADLLPLERPDVGRELIVEQGQVGLFERSDEGGGGLEGEKGRGPEGGGSGSKKENKERVVSVRQSRGCCNVEDRSSREKADRAPMTSGPQPTGNSQHQTGTQRPPRAIPTRSRTLAAMRVLCRGKVGEMSRVRAGVRRSCMSELARKPEVSARK